MVDTRLVLVVDDSFQNRELLIEILQANGYETAEASSGAEALAFVRNKLPNLILLDVIMPEMDGFETCVRLQKEGFNDIPIIFMTAVNDSQSIHKAFELGAADYISQPVRQAELLARLEVQFQKHLLLETLWKQNERLEEDIIAIQTKANQDAERLHLALQVTGLGIWEWNIHNHSIYWSPETHKLFGLEDNDFDGKYETYLSLIHKDDRDNVQAAITKALENPSENYEIEHRAIRKTGEMIWIKGEGRVICDETGKATRILGTVFDKTKEKLEELVVLESQAILQTQTETLMTVNQIANSLYQALSIDELAIRAIDACCTYLGADSGAFYVVEGDMLRRIQTLNVPAEHRPLGATLPLEGSLTGAMVKSGKMIVSEDIGEDERYVTPIQAFLVEMGIKRLISIPLSYNDEILGAMNIGFKDLPALEGDIRTTLETIGKTIGLALSNVYTLEQMRREVFERQKAEQVQKILFEISRATARTDSLRELLAEVRQQLGKLIECENFYVALYDDTQETYSFPYWQDNYSTEAETWVTRSLPKSRPEYVRQRGEGCILNESSYTELINLGILNRAPIPSLIWMAVPLKTAQKVIGVMAVQSYTNPAAYSEADLQVMSYVADNIVWVLENKRIEEALRNSEELFSKAFYASPDSVTVASVTTGRIMQINQGFERIYGYSAAEVVGREVLDLNIYVNNADRPVMLAILEREGRVRDFELKCRHKSGRLIDCMMSVEYTDVRGEACLVSIARDITERKEAQEALRRSEATAREFQKMLRELLEISIELASLDREDEVYQHAVLLGRERLAYDRLGLFMIDLEKQEVIGTFGTDPKGQLRDERQISWPLENAKELIRIIKEGRKSSIREDIDLYDAWQTIGHGWQGSAVLWDGGRAIGSLAVDNLLSQKPVRPYEEELLGLFGVVLGYVIAGKRKESSRQKLLEHLRIVNGIDQAILLAESPKAIAQVVVERLQSMLGCDYASIFSVDEESNMMHMLAWSLGTQLLESIPLASAQLLDIQQLERGIVIKYPNLAEIDHISDAEALLNDWGIRSFAIIPLLVDKVLVGTLNLGKREIGAIGEEQLAIAQEIATQLSVAIRQARLLEQVQAYASDLETLVKVRTEQLESKASELEAFTYSVSHDLRSPLRAMSGFADVLMDDYATELGEEARHYLERIRHNAQRMGTLIDDLLALSRVGRRELSRQDLDTKTIIQEILAELEADGQIGSAEIQIQDLAPCQADPVLMKQLWFNLINNAIKYSKRREKPQIQIGSRIENHEMVYFISDNGVGFDMQYAEKLFGVFQRLHTSSEYEGTGIGLATVHRIIEKHNGRIWAKAEVDKGANFYFVLGKAL